MVNKQEFLDTYNYFEKSFLIEIIDIFISEHVGRFEKIYADINARDFNALRFDAHSLKGVIANFCAPVAWELARDLEKKGSYLQDNDGDGFNETEILGQIDALRNAVNSMVVELSDLKIELQTS